MARYRKIDVRMWGDEKFRRLTAPQPCGQSLWQYLLTNPDTVNIPGLYRAGEAGMAEALGWPMKAFREAFAEVLKEGMVESDWEARVLWIPNAIEYNEPESPNVVKSWRDTWDEIPECSLKIKAYQHFKAFLKGMGEAFLKAFVEGCSQPRDRRSEHPSPNQEQEQEQEQEQDKGVGAENGATPTDSASQPPKERPTADHLVGMWNELAHPNLPRVRVLSEAVKRSASARLVEEPEISFWQDVIRKVSSSKLCRGEVSNRNGQKPWRATFDWLVNPTNLAKVVNGNYD